jgi:hypothetical protein
MRRSAFIHLIVAGALALSAAGAYAAWFLTLRGTVANADALSAEIARIEREDAAIASAKDIAATLEADEAALEAYFVSEDGIVPFLEELERTGDELGSAVEVVSVAPGSGTDAGRVTLAMRISGSFAAVMRTIGAFEYGPHDLRIGLLSLDERGGDDGSSWSASATFSAGLLPDAASETTP